MNIDDLLFQDQKISALIKDNKYFDVNSSKMTGDDRLRSTGTTATYPEFIKLVDKLIELTNKSRERQITFTQYRGNDSRDDIPLPLVTHRVYRRVPQEIKPRPREPINDPENEGRAINVMGQKFDYTVELTIIDSDYSTADETMHEIEDLLSIYAGFLKKQGVSEIRFSEQLTDDAVNNKESFYCIKLRYTVVLERITLMSDVKIQQIIAQIQLS